VLFRSGITYDNPFSLTETTEVNARGFLDGEWSALTRAIFVVTESGDNFVVSEINFNPPDPTTTELLANPDVNNDDFEFIEVRNVGADPFNVVGIEFSDGIDFTFPSVELAAGDYGVVVSDVAAFELRYGSSINVLGQYNGNLRNSGERVELLDPLGTTLLEFEYGDSDPWPVRADGAGGTLVLVDETSTPEDEFSKYYRWTGSSEFGGSPGTAGVTAQGIVINEVLTNTDESPTQSDAIELHNTASTSIDISGWFISDTSVDLLKFEIPAGTMLGPNEYVVFDENDFNPNPDAPADSDFALNGDDGDDVWLIIPNGSGGVETFVDDIHFGAARLGESLGRVPDDSPRLAPLGRTTLGCGNSHARVGPLVMSEIHYSPSAPSPGADFLGLTRDDLQFIEVHNPTTVGVDLTNWRIRGGIDFDFPPSTMIGAGETIILVSFDPAVAGNANLVEGFSLHHGIGESDRLMGDFSGQLSDDGELIRLQRPGDAPIDDPEFVPRLTEDSVLYDTVAPWPEADPLGPGLSIERIAPVFFGSTATSWASSTGSPGFVSFTAGAEGDLTGDGAADAADIDTLYDAIARGSETEYFDLDESLTVDSSDVTFLVETIIGSYMGDTNLDGRVSAADLNQVGIHWQATNCVGWSTGDLTGDGKVNAADLNVLGVNWQNGVALAAPKLGLRVPRAPLAVAATPAVIIEEVFGDETNARSFSDVELDRSKLSSNISRASHTDHMTELVRSSDIVTSRRFRSPVAHGLRRVNRSTQIVFENEQVELLDDLFARVWS
jgi:hypothetical protein